jgi:hypothetical protein
MKILKQQYVMSEEKVITLKPKRKILKKFILAEIREVCFFINDKRKTITTIVVAVILLIVFCLKMILPKKKGILYFVSFLFLLCAIFSFCKHQ